MFIVSLERKSKKIPSILGIFSASMQRERSVRNCTAKETSCRVPRLGTKVSHQHFNLSFVDTESYVWSSNAHIVQRTRDLRCGPYARFFHMNVFSLVLQYGYYLRELLLMVSCKVTEIYVYCLFIVVKVVFSEE